jgi:hypothetical protein
MEKESASQPVPLTYRRAATSVERTRLRLHQAQAELRLAIDILSRLEPESRNGLEEASLESFMDQLRAAEIDLVRRTRT